MNTASTAILTLLLLLNGQDPPVAGSDDRPVAASEQRDRLLTQIKSADLKLRQDALQAILNQPDPLLLPGLQQILDQPDSGLRRQVTLVVLKSYPDRSFQFFQDVLKSNGIHGREAAAHAFGLIRDVRVIPLLESLVDDPDERIRTASIRSLQALIRADLPHIFQRVSGQQLEVKESTDEVRSIARKALNQLGRIRPTNSNLQVARLRCMDSDLSQQNRKAWLQDLDIEASQLGILTKFLFTQQCWLGRTKPPSALKYHFSMVNVTSGSSKEIDIDATPVEIEMLRALDYDLDRVIHLRFVSDLIFNIPSALSPRFDFTPEHVDVVFNYDRYPFPQAGIGLLNISYWETRITKGGTGHLRFDPVTFQLQEETLKDSQGNVLWKVTVTDWLEDHPTYPFRILIDVPGGVVGSKQMHMKFDLKFQNTNESWLLSEATAVEVTPDGDNLRAYCEVSSVSPGEDSVEEGDPSGSSADSDSGQGSRAGSPRE